MARMVWVLAGVLLWGICGAATATESPGYLQFDLGLQSYYHQYEEPGVMENDGWFLGLEGRLAYENRLYLGLEGLVSFGRVDYASVNTGTGSDHDDICVDVRGLLGIVALKTPGFKLIPYTGLGYRFLQDDSQSQLTSTNHLGYLRESNYLYSPLGLKWAFNLGQGWRLEADTVYHYFWLGRQESFLGYIAGYEDVENDQDEGFGYKLSADLKKHFARFSLGLGVFYRYWDIKRSEITVDSAGRGWIEPANTTDEFGFRITMGF